MHRASVKTIYQANIKQRTSLADTITVFSFSRLLHYPNQYCMHAGFDNGHFVLHICWSAGRPDGYELVLCCGRDTFGKHSHPESVLAELHAGSFLLPLQLVQPSNFEP